MSTTLRKPEPRTRWVIASLLVVVVNVLLFGLTVGECKDYAAESGAVSTCVSGPVLGYPGTWALGILSLFALAYFAHRFLRRAVSR